MMSAVELQRCMPVLHTCILQDSVLHAADISSVAQCLSILLKQCWTSVLNEIIKKLIQEELGKNRVHASFTFRRSRWPSLHV